MNELKCGMVGDILSIEFLNITRASCKEVSNLFEKHPEIRKKIIINDITFEVVTWKEYFEYVEKQLWDGNKLSIGDCSLLRLEEVGEPYTSTTISDYKRPVTRASRKKNAALSSIKK